MKLERLVQIHVALLVSIGALLLGLAQGDLLLTVMVLFAAVTSVVFTDSLGWLRLNRGLANVAAMVALFFSLSDFLEAGLRSRLLAVASLLVYLQIVLFYQRKNPRLYWQLIILSLLQVVVSAALNVPLQFGVLLILYAGVAISTLTVFFLHREVTRIALLGRRSRAGRGARRPEASRSLSGVQAVRRMLDSRALVALPSFRGLAAQTLERGLFFQVLVLGTTTLVFAVVLFFSAPRLDSATRRALTRPTQSVVGFSSEIRLNQLRDVLQSNETVMRVAFRDHATERPYEITGVPYLRGSVLSDYVATAGESGWKQRSSWAAPAAYRGGPWGSGRVSVEERPPFFVPTSPYSPPNPARERFGAPPWQPRSGSPRPHPAAAASETGAPREPASATDGDNSPTEETPAEETAAASREVRWQSHRLQAAPNLDFLVRQEIIVEPLDQSVLFALTPIFAGHTTSQDVSLDPLSKRLYSQSRRNTPVQREYRYDVVTSALRGGLQMEVTPHVFRTRSEWNDFCVEQEKLRLLQFDARRFPRLREIADEIGQAQAAGSARPAVRARALRDHFLEPGRYHYTLDLGSVSRDNRLDPIEDFVANHRAGHCEYYASALALMLRSQGIPARLVVGFHCDEFNLIGGYYQVRQLHAHAWVEAYLEPDEVLEELPPGSDTSPYGGWLRLDPTPGFDVDRAVQVRRGMTEAIDDVLDYAQVLWTDYILGLTASRQRESIYDTVTETTDPDTWAPWLKQLSEQRQTLTRWLSRVLLHPRTLVLVSLATLLSFGLWVRVVTRRSGQMPPVVRRVTRWTARLRGGDNERARRQRVANQVVFYRRFERLLRQLGLARGHGQTQREFGVVAAQRLAAAVAWPQSADFATRLIETFYRVRFGRVELEPVERESLEDGLVALEQQVTQHVARQAASENGDGSSEG